MAWRAFSLSEAIMLDLLILMALSPVLAVLIFKG
jgi:hypothetical protein